MPGAARPCVVVTTYDRPDQLSRLLDDLEREMPPGGLDVRVYDDATPEPDPRIQRRLTDRGWAYRRADVNHGKQRWWQWWNAILGDLRDHRPSHFYFLQDDVRLCRRFFDRGATSWDAIPADDRGSLMLYRLASRGELGSRCWTPVRAVPAGDVVECGWVDLAAFMCDRRLLDALAWRLEPVSERRWVRDPLLSSGVGQQMSLRAHACGLRMYRTDRSLVVHGGRPSLMNPGVPRPPVDTVAFVDGDDAAERLLQPRARVYASLASVPEREDGLRQVVAALLDQVDGLGVYLNGYARVPAFLGDPRIEVFRSEEHGDRGDAGKFHRAGTVHGHHLVCDDDIAYPSDYVERLLEGVERHGRRAAVGFHGRLLEDGVPDYHRSRALLHFTRALAADTVVHVLGTGVAGYHASAIDVTPADFPVPNMADVWFALLGQRRRVPFVCLRREAGWLRELPGYRSGSLYERATRRAMELGGRPSPETRAARTHARWELHAGDDRVAAGPESSDERRFIRVRVAGHEREATLVLLEDDHITAAVQRSGTYYERDLLDALRERARAGTFVDVGAHFGNHTAFFGIECGADRVVAIEPNPLAHAGLLQTITENGLGGRVVAHRLAVHPTWRQVRVEVLPWRPPPQSPGRTNSGRVTVRPAGDAADTAAAPLDEVLAGVRDVTLVKVDADGMSADVLASGVKTLRRERPLVAAGAGNDAELAALRAVMEPLRYREVHPPYGWTSTWLWEPA